MFVPIQEVENLDNWVIHAAIQKQKAFTQSIQLLKITNVPNLDINIFNTTLHKWIQTEPNTRKPVIKSIDNGNKGSLFVYYYEQDKKKSN